MSRVLRIAVVLSASVALSACSAPASECTADEQCASNETCIKGGGVFVSGGRCVLDDPGSPASDASARDAWNPSEDASSEDTRRWCGVFGAEACSAPPDSSDGGTPKDTPVSDVSNDTGGCTDGDQENCYPGPAGTAGVGICKRGTRTCRNGSWSSCEGAVTPASSEVCDGQKDDNCDGRTDEGCDCTNGDTKGCYTGPGGTKGTGICSGGTRQCSNGSWGGCQGETTPKAEKCGDGMKDSNCNRWPNDGCGCAYMNSTTGVCNKATVSSENGNCEPPSTYESPETTKCNDGRDNDCDGTRDEC